MRKKLILTSTLYFPEQERTTRTKRNTAQHKKTLIPLNRIIISHRIN